MSSIGDETVFPFMEPESFVNESRVVIDFIANYYSNVENYPVQSRVKPGYLKSLIPENAPLCPESLENILQDVTHSIIPGLTHWQSPNFFAYYQANASTAGFLGEMLCSGFNVVGFSWIASPAATELESIVMDWMGKMLKLPTDFLFSGNGGGVLLGSTCEAIVCTLVAARDRAGPDKVSKLVVYGSDQTHFTLHKASKIVGIPSRNFRNLKTSASNDFALSPGDVRAAMVDDIKNGLIPLYLCASIGTTACGAVDPIEELGKIARDYNVWLHVDAAYAGSACICPEFRHYLDGVELVQSVSMNPHKWFLTNMDCCCLWVKNPSSLLDSLSMDSDIMRNSFSEAKEVVDYRDWQISLSKRFRAVKLWVVIRRHGLANLMQHIRSDVSMAKRFKECVAKDNRFEVLVPRKFALVCFRLKPKAESEGSELNQKLLSDINSSGRAFMTQAIVGGKFAIRCAIGSTLTEVRHVNDLWKLIQEKADKILS